MEAGSVSGNAERPGLTQLWCSERRPRDPDEVPLTLPAGTRTPDWVDELPKRRATAELGPCSGLDAVDGRTSAIVERRRNSDVIKYDEDDDASGVTGAWKLAGIT